MGFLLFCSLGRLSDGLTAGLRSVGDDVLGGHTGNHAGGHGVAALLPVVEDGMLGGLVVGFLGLGVDALVDLGGAVHHDLIPMPQGLLHDPGLELGGQGLPSGDLPIQGGAGDAGGAPQVVGDLLVGPIGLSLQQDQLLDVGQLHESLAHQDDPLVVLAAAQKLQHGVVGADGDSADHALGAGGSRDELVGLQEDAEGVEVLDEDFFAEIDLEVGGLRDGLVSSVALEILKHNDPSFRGVICPYKIW